jgi:hypothetical protein
VNSQRLLALLAVSSCAPSGDNDHDTTDASTPPLLLPTSAPMFQRPIVTSLSLETW